MTLKEELEIHRGVPIDVFDVAPMEIPCIETSDVNKLCKSPVVSVHMITYNHEPYIRKAIEGVMMQKTDFEFELVIGEDCSQDKTREICFEYQKKYPDKIRVLWWHENVSKLGGNSGRVMSHCRGELIALCEGDDYWIDETKLQRQVDVMRANTKIAMCCHQFNVFKNGYFSKWNESRLRELTERGGDEYGFLFSKYDFFNPGIFAQTATVMYRKSLFDVKFYTSIKKKCDISLFYTCLRHHNGYFINRTMSVYRITDNSLWQGMSEKAKAEWHLGIANALYEAEPGVVTKRILDAAKRRLRCTRWPFAAINKFRIAIRVKLSRFKQRSLRAINYLKDFCEDSITYEKAQVFVLKYKPKFVHIIHEEKFTKPFVDFINKNFNREEHLFLCRISGDKKFNYPHPTDDNVFLLKRIFSKVHLKKHILEKYINVYDKAIFHSLFYTDIINYLYVHPRILQDKAYWMIWGGDLYNAPRSPNNDYVRSNFCGIVTDTDGDEFVYEQHYGKPRKVFNAGYTFPITREMIDNSKFQVRDYIRIQINNSCDRSTMEVLQWLSAYKDESIRVRVIHSYGDMGFAEEIETLGKKIFGYKFEAIKDFLSPNEYAQHMAQNDVLVLNQNRQQGLGNCFAALALGVKLFIRSEISTFNHLTTKGCVVHDTKMIKNMSFKDMVYVNKQELLDNKNAAAPFFSGKYLKGLWDKVFSA